MKLLYTILCLFVCHIVHSQTWEVHGTVRDEKKQPVVRAKVQASQGGITKGIAETDSNGYYLIKLADSGIYDIGATARAHFPFSKKILVAKNIQQDLSIDSITKEIMHMLLNPPVVHKGKITDRHNHPINGAIVQSYLCGSLAETYTTDSSGNYILYIDICTVPWHGPAYLTITCPGYKSRKIELRKIKKVDKNFTLRRKWWQSKK